MAEVILIALIDDDAAVLDSLRQYLARRQVSAICFASADDFFGKAETKNFECIVADVRMPGLSGIELVERLGAAKDPTPVILITGHGDVDMAVSAIKLGAFDFIEKPFDESRLLESIHNAGAARRQSRNESAQKAELAARAQGLSVRQREVMDLAVMGLSNKEIAIRLGISPKTVEIHRAWMMERMGARNLAELVRLTMQMRT